MNGCNACHTTFVVVINGCCVFTMNAPAAIQAEAEKLGVDISAAQIVDPACAPALDQYVEDLVEARKKKVRCMGASLISASAVAVLCRDWMAQWPFQGQCVRCT